jgi:hypothetical protein
MVVCPINKNHLNRCFTKSLGRGQSAEAPTHNSPRGLRALPGVSFRYRDVIRLRHRSVLFSHFFLKLLTREISQKSRGNHDWEKASAATPTGRSHDSARSSSQST